MSAALPMFTEQQLKDALSAAFPFDAEPDGSWTLIESERRTAEAVIAARDAQWQAYATQARADLEAENAKLREALRNLLNDTQHAEHPDCEDGPCPVREARAALEKTND